jgi:hypothetical protein
MIGMYITCVFYAARKYQASTTVLVQRAIARGTSTVVLVLVLALKLKARLLKSKTEVACC